MNSPQHFRRFLIFNGIGLGILVLLIVTAAAQADDSPARTAFSAFAIVWALIGAIAFPISLIATLVHASRHRRGIRQTASDSSAVPNPTRPRMPLVSPTSKYPPVATSAVSPPEHTISTSPPEPEPARIQRLPAYVLLGTGNYPNTEVEGEFARVRAIAALIGGQPLVDEQVVLDDLDAQLMPEPRNRHDRNAVRVVIDEHHVGYLDRATAATYAPELAAIVAAGYAPTVPARIWAVTRHDWASGRKKMHANVRVALGDPARTRPTNNPPEAPYSMLPWANAIQVTGEDQHLEILTSHVQEDVATTAIGTLHETTTVAARGPGKPVVEVCIDGDVIGTLTPAMSQHYLPTIRHLEEQGMQTAAWLTVKGSAIAAHVTVQAPKAHELPSDWFGTAHTIPALHPGRPAASHRPEPMWDD